MSQHHDRALIGWGEKMQKTRTEIETTARSNMNVLVRGEPGTGKELVARAIHAKSNRAGGPFVSLNCAALPESLIESELFGCERGAFTGAVRRKGQFELAHGGTLFLDEIGELSMMAQPKLLRVLETREVLRIGGERPVPVDFRLVVATNQDLEEMIETRRFRADLYERLNMDTIRIPPLRERLEDIPALAQYFIGVYVSEAQRMVNGISQAVLDLFRTHGWPGNIRELENVVRRAVFKGGSEMIELQDLPADFAKKKSVKLVSYRERMRDYSSRLLLEALKRYDGNRTRAAEHLDLSRSQLHRLLLIHRIADEPDANGRKRRPDQADFDVL